MRILREVKKKRLMYTLSQHFKIRIKFIFFGTSPIIFMHINYFFSLQNPSSIFFG